MAFRLSARSLRNLEGVHPDLVAVAKRAIVITKVDFGVTEGLRSAERQAALKAAGASTVNESRHQTGHAIDVAAYIGPRVSWELPLYYDIAHAFQSAAAELAIPVRWGGCWMLLSGLPHTPRGIGQAVQQYSDSRRAQGRRAFIDGPHYELPASRYPA